MPEVDVSKIELKKVKVNDIELAYKVFGEGEPLLLIMGFSGAMDMWPPYVLGAFSSHYKVIIFDSRGIGESSVTDKKFSIELFADDTAGLIDALGIKKINILGWSMGTEIAQELTLKYPEKVNSVVLYAADPGAKASIRKEGPLDAITNTSGSLGEREKRVMSVLFPEKWRKAHSDIRKYFPAPREITPIEDVIRQADALKAWQGSFERLEQIKCPTLFIVGAEDVVTLPINSVNMSQKISGSCLIQIEGAGHGLMYQFPEKFSQTVLDFFKGKNKK